jgi:exosortase A-associated hydrolase 2
MELWDETPFFFPSTGGGALFGVFHRPAAIDTTRPAFVFCHPLAEEKLWAHRVFVSYARHLAAAGYPVLRFDMTGNGDSEGEFSALSVERACADLRDAIAEVRRLTDGQPVSLLGLRLGATVASLVAETATEIRHLVLWSPVTDGERYVQDLLRSNVMTQMAVYKEVRQERHELVAVMEQGRTVNVDGYEMGWPLYSTIAAVKLGGSPRLFTGPCLIVQIDKQPRPAADLQRLAATYDSAVVEFAQEEPFWKEIARFYQDAPNLFAVTDEWLGRRMTPR